MSLRCLVAAFLGLFLGTVAGILLWPFLVYRQSGAVQKPWREPYDGEAIGV